MPTAILIEKREKRMKKVYKKPQIKVVDIKPTKILTSSSQYAGCCDDCCKYWHICRDREKGKLCKDKKY